MKTPPSISLIALWAGELAQCASTVKDMAIHQLTDDAMKIMDSILLDAGCHVKALREHIKSAKDEV